MIGVPTSTNICGIEGALSSSGADTLTGWPAGKGRGGEGSFTSTIRPAGNGLGGEGSCETGTWVEFGKGAGKAVQVVTTEAATRERVENFILLNLNGL